MKKEKYPLIDLHPDGDLYVLKGNYYRYIGYIKIENKNKESVELFYKTIKKLFESKTKII